MGWILYVNWKDKTGDWVALKDLKASDKKRKSSGDDSSLEANVADLDAFNYARQMENLSIDSDTDTEVEV